MRSQIAPESICALPPKTCKPLIVYPFTQCDRVCCVRDDGELHEERHRVRRKRQGNRLMEAGVVFGGRAYFASYTVFPPTTVPSTFVAKTFSGVTAVRSRSRTTKSASIPGASL